MKKVIWGLVVVIFVIGTMFGVNLFLADASASGGTSPAPVVVVAEPVLELSGEAKIVIMGAGFEPGQEVRLATSILGARSDIGFQLDQEPVANETGAWITAWSPDRYISRKMLEEGALTIEVTDAEYNPITYAVVAFYDASKPQEERPAWAPAMTGE